MAQRCITCNREVANGVTEAYDARKATCADWGQRCQKGADPDARAAHDAATEENARLERVYAEARASRDRHARAADIDTERAGHRAILEATAESVVEGEGALSEEEERQVADKARRAAKK